MTPDGEVGSASNLSAPLRVVFLPAWPDNPYQELLASALEREGAQVSSLQRRLVFVPDVLRHGRPHIVHFHAADHFVLYRRTAPRAFVALTIYALQLVTLRALGVRIVWTAHDATNHERRFPRIDALTRAVTGTISSGIFVHCRAAKDLIGGWLGPAAADKTTAIPFGDYRARYAPGAADDRAEARQRLSLSANDTILLFFGNLRTYKGLPELINGWMQLAPRDARLVIAGEAFTPEIERDIRARVPAGASIDLRIGYVPDELVRTYMAAADAVVCPFTRSLTSGSVALAMAFGRPCIAPRLGCTPEMLTEEGGVLYDPASPDALQEALKKMLELSPNARDSMGAANEMRARQNDWGTVARATLAVYRAALKK